MQHANEHARANFSDRLIEYEDRLTRIRDSRNAAIDKWKTARSSLLDSIEELEHTVCCFVIINPCNLTNIDWQADLRNKKDLQKFNVPPLLPSMTIRQLVAEPPGNH